MCTTQAADTITATGQAGTNRTRPRRWRHKLWELEERFHCAVIGTCLSLDELQRICRKAKITFHTPPTDHELHSAFVNIAGEPVYATRLLQKQLEAEYRQTIRHFKRAGDAAQLAELWDQALESGEVAGAFWALVTHPSVSRDLLDRVYGEIHMLSHLAGASTRVDMQELVALRQRVDALETQQRHDAEEAQRRLHRSLDTIRTLETRLKQAQQAQERLRIVERRLAEMSDGETLATRLQDLSTELAHTRSALARAERENGEWQRQARRLEARNARLERSLADTRQERDALESSLASLLTGDCPAPCMGTEGDLKHLDLCGRSILYVGGRTAQHTHFRTLVERANGHFMHHDGGREDSQCQLTAVLQKADAVLCPLDCVSHNAMHRVKRFCKRNQKRLMFLPRASLSAFSRGLSEVAA